MKNSVKITTLEWLLDLIYPCYCKGCGKIGTVFCERCFFDNVKKNRPFSTEKDKDFHRIFACGMREGALSEMISGYKFQSRRHYRKVLAKYLELTISRFSRGERYVLVPLPTIQRHIRERGFDHIKLLTQEFSSLTGFPVVAALKRQKSGVQVGATAKQRLEQAKEAYLINSKANLDIKSHFLLVDDVWTTGASMRAARGVLETELLRLGAKKNEIKISAICLAKNDGYEF
jgi:ComF family protein